jgi:hypothetical protein
MTDAIRFVNLRVDKSGCFPTQRAVIALLYFCQCFIDYLPCGGKLGCSMGNVCPGFFFPVPIYFSSFELQILIAKPAGSIRRAQISMSSYGCIYQYYFVSLTCFWLMHSNEARIYLYNMSICLLEMNYIYIGGIYN